MSDETISQLRKAIHSPSGGSPSLKSLNELGNLLSDRHTRTGDVEDLEESSQTSRQVIDITSQNHLEQAEFLTDCANRLIKRYTTHEGLLT